MQTVITPLFEKMLSASDAGRIGRLVLPKACAEVWLKYIPGTSADAIFCCKCNQFSDFLVCMFRFYVFKMWVGPF